MQRFKTTKICSIVIVISVLISFYEVSAKKIPAFPGAATERIFRDGRELRRQVRASNCLDHHGAEPAGEEAPRRRQR